MKRMKMIIKIVATVGILALCLGTLAGCTNQNTQNQTKSPLATADANALATNAPKKGTIEAPVDSAKQTVFPLEVKDAFDSKVSVKTFPNKIVSLSPTATEIVFALGAGGRLVGRTDYCDYPAEAAQVQSVGEILNPSFETIVGIKPDIIFASLLTDAKIITKLKDLGFTIYMVDDMKGIDGAYYSISTFGKLLDAQSQAEGIISAMKDKIKNISAKVSATSDRPTVYYVVGFGDGGDYTAGAGSFIDEAIKIAGGINSGAAAVNWKFSLEQLIKDNPSIIICPTNPDIKSAFVTADKYKDLGAVKAGKVYSIDNNKLDRAGSRIADGVEELSKIINPAAWN